MGERVEELLTQELQALQQIGSYLALMLDELRTFNANAETFMEAILNRIDAEGNDCQDK